MPDTGWFPLTPFTRARPKRTGLVVLTPGTASTRRSTVGEKGEKPSVFCTTNAALRLSSTDLAIVVLTPAAKIDTNVTSATPTISAAAVTAVRPGWRIVFSRARRPVMPRVLSNGRPMTEASGRTRYGLTSATPRNVASAPPPTKLRDALDENEPKSPAAMRPTPTRPRATPANVTLRDGPRPGGTAASWSASTGDTRVARRAGASDEKTVTTMPTTIETMIVRDAITLPLLGRSTPIARNSARSPPATPTPSSSPATEPSSPIVKPSVITERMNWPRDAPSVRSIANSRIRCVTVIEKVLKMMNAPTNSEIPANASSSVVRKLRLLLMSSDCLCASSWPVRTLTVFGSALFSWSRSSAGVTPCFAEAWIWSNPRLPSIRCASGSSMSAIAAPPSESAPAIWVVPTSVNSLRGAVPTIATLSPSFQPCFFTVDASIATSSGLCGLRPFLIVNPSKRGWSATEAMKFGAPPLPMRLPSLPRIVPTSNTEPSALCTPGCRRTCARIAGETVGCVPPWLLVSIGFRGVIDASVPFADWVKIWSNERLIVSVKTYVPAISVTPSATASAVRISRSFRANSPRRATLRMGSADRLHEIQDVLGGVRLSAVVDDLAVGEHEQAVGVGGGRRVVRDHDDGLAELVDGAAQEVEHLTGGLRVEVAGRLVGEDDGGLARERAGHRDALLLAARELGRPVGEAVAQADGVDELVEPLRVRPLAGDRQRQHDVLARVEDRQEVERLEDEADALAAQLGEPAVVERGDLDAVQDDRPGGRAVEAGEDVHQRRLARAGRAHDRREAALREVDRHAVERADGGLALAVDARDVLGGDDEGTGKAHGSEPRPGPDGAGTASRTSGRGPAPDVLPRPAGRLRCRDADGPDRDRRRARPVAPRGAVPEHRELRPAARLRVGRDADGARRLARRTDELGALGRRDRRRAGRVRADRRGRARGGGRRGHGVRAHRPGRGVAAGGHAGARARHRLRLRPVPVPRAGRPRRPGRPARGAGRAGGRDRRHDRRRRLLGGADGDGRGGRRRGRPPRRRRQRGADRARRDAGGRLAPGRRRGLRRRRLPRLQVADVRARDGVHARAPRGPRPNRAGGGRLVRRRGRARLVLRTAAAPRLQRPAARHVAGLVLVGGDAAGARARRGDRRRRHPRPRRRPREPLPRRPRARAAELGDRLGRRGRREGPARGGGHRRGRARRAAADVVAPLQHRGRRRRGSRRAGGRMSAPAQAAGFSDDAALAAAFAPFFEERRALLPEGTAVLDAHTHLGVDEDGQSLALEALLAALDEVSPDARACTFPLHDPDRRPGYRVPNDRVLGWAAESGGRLVPSCRLDPAEDPVAEAERCLARGARGIKLHPRAQAFEFGNSAAESIFTVAREAGVPILIHAGRGMAPMDALAGLALRFPEVALVLAHAGIAGQGMFASRLADHPAVVYDTSTLSPFDVIELFARVPAERIVFASVVPYGRPAFALYQAMRIGRMVAGLDGHGLRMLAGGAVAAVLGGGAPAEAGPPRVAQVRRAVGRLLRGVTYLLSAFASMLAGDGRRDPARALPWIAMGRTACRDPEPGPAGDALARIDASLDAAERLILAGGRPAFAAVGLVHATMVLAATEPAHQDGAGPR